MRRLHQQEGFTVVEMLVVAMVLGVVVAGALTLMNVVMRQGSGVLQHTESAQRGRLALDQMTRQIRSQVCLNETTKGLISAAPNSLTFYADLGDGGAGNRPTKRMLNYQPASRTLRESVWVANAGGVYPTTATRSTVLLDNVDQTPDPTAPAKPLGLFSYYAYRDPLPAAPRPDVALTPTTAGAPLSAAQLARVAMVRINYTVRPPSTANDKVMTPLRDDIQLRNADPNATTPDPTCT